ncbi:MAG: hypothetical protein JNK72_12780 [Myxococcales bacterium]|nr:hypothetical protein [Myxococcales bacterium]
MSIDELMLRRRSLLVGGVAACALPLLPGCAPDESDAGLGDDGGDLIEEVTDVSHTEVRRQSIGNCWAYAAVGWAESLHLARTGNRVNISESWITFWDWYAKIQQSYGGIERNATSMRDEISTGGWWDTAANILRNKGVVFEADFIPEEATAERSTRQSEALAAINADLNGMGELVDPTRRRDGQIVLNRLMEAWRLGDDVRALIRRVFGLNGRGTLSSTRERALGFIKRPTDFQVRTSYLRNGRVSSIDTTLASVVPGGAYAWKSASYPSYAQGRIDLQRKVFRALNAQQPVLISWLVDFNARTARSVFDLTAISMPGRQGGHLTVMEDYQVTIREPNREPRTLAAGTPASAADMALAERYGELEFIRIKNSWGNNADPSNTGTFGGYNDLLINYLNGPIRWTADSSMRTPWSSVILPNGF